jgi:hypothetical protein
VTKNITGKNFPFGTNFKIETDFEIQIQEETGFGIWLKFKRASNLLWKILEISPKFYLLKIFNIVNLDGLTCIQKFEVPLQVAIRT